MNLKFKIFVVIAAFSFLAPLRATVDQWAFLEAIRADPKDDAPRLIHADWLDEQGEGRPRGVYKSSNCS